jgi:AraC family transcriptional regulator
MAIATESVAAGLQAWRVRRVTEHIEQNIDKPLPLTELAAVVYMSRFHFARLFRRSTGDSPHRFVIRQRIARACEFLARSELTIAEISRRVGFRTPSHFTTMFRRVSGVTPRGYRIEHAREARPRDDGRASSGAGGAGGVMAWGRGAGTRPRPASMSATQNNQGKENSHGEH